MSSRLFGEIFCKLAKEGKQGRSVTKVFCLEKSAQVDTQGFVYGKAWGHGLHEELLCTQLGLAWVLIPIMPMALSFTYHIKLIFLR
jgi:hypothetical protein